MSDRVRGPKRKSRALSAPGVPSLGSKPGRPVPILSPSKIIQISPAAPAETAERQSLFKTKLMVPQEAVIPVKSGIQMVRKNSKMLDSGACPGPDPGFGGMPKEATVARASIKIAI